VVLSLLAIFLIKSVLKKIDKKIISLDNY